MPRPQRFTRTLRRLTEIYPGYKALWGQRPPVTFAELFERLHNHPHEEFVIGTLSQLFRARASGRDRRRALSILFQIAKTSACSAGAEWATYDLSFSFQPRAVPYLLALLKDVRHPAVGAQAAEGIGDCVTERAVRRQRSQLYTRCVTALLAALDDPHPSVRFYAAFSLGKLRARTTLPRLRELAEHDSMEVSGMWSVKEEAIDAIHTIEHGSFPEVSACERTGGLNRPRLALATTS